MRRYHAIGIAALLGVLTACERPTPPPADGTEASFNLTAYLQEQTVRLQQDEPPVLKSVMTKGQAVETTETSEVDWEKELAIFQEVDLSRPALRDFYQEESHVLPNGSTLRIFTKEAGASAPVERLQLTLSPFQKMERLEATVLEENILFYSTRNITLLAEPGTGNLWSYRVEGVQKLVFGDSLRYRVDANL